MIAGAVTVQVQVFALLDVSWEDVIPLNANVVAEGDAVVLDAPGKVMTILPLDGTALTVVN
jgi:N-dimethylarginine dimethylaminohydrolase